MSEEKQDFTGIVKELIEVFKKLGQKELVDILKKFKPSKQEDTESMILSWNVAFNADKEDVLEFDENGILIKDKKKKESQPWIDIFGQMFPVWYLFSISKEERYNFDNNEMSYYITINKGIETKSTILKDIMIKYTSQEERDQNIASFKEKLITFDIKFI
jgi:hypothetical protein